MKKFFAILMAVLLIASLSVTAFAETTTQHGTENSTTGTVSFNLPKDIVLFNTTAGTSIYEPNVTYTYALTAGAPGTATITDDPAVSTYDGNTDKSVTVQVKAGTGGVTIQGSDLSSGTNTAVVASVGGTTTVVFGDGDHDTAASYAYTTLGEGTTVESTTTAKASRNIVVSIDPTSDAFKQTVDGVTNFVPGVYRYHIAETANTANANGVKTPDGRLTDLTLDVYLKWTDNTHTALQVYGYVLFRGLTENESLSYDSSATASTAKITGFDVASNMKSDANGDITSTADEYHTFNTTVSKAVSGGLADRNNAFPFTIELTGINTTEFYYTKTGVPTSRNKAAADGLKTMGTGITISEGLKDGESITIYGLPYNATVKVTEQNNTPDYYTPSATFNSANITSELTITDSFQPTKTAATPVYNNEKAATAKTLASTLTEDTIAFTNTLAEVSPTGIVMRVAPYAILLTAGLFLFLFSRRTRKVED